MKTRILFGLLASLWAAIMDLHAAQPLFAVGFQTAIYTNSSVLYRVDDYHTNVPSASKIGDTHVLFNGFAIDPTAGTFYGVGLASPYVLYTLSGSDAVVGPAIGSKIWGLAFDRMGQLWGISNTTLCRIEKVSGALAPLANTVGVPLGDWNDLAFDTNGSLYACSETDLIRINLSTGHGTTVGSFGTTGIFGLAIDTDGVMYAAKGDPGCNTPQGTSVDCGLVEMYVVNKSTATASLVRRIERADGFSVGGLDFLGNTNTPAQPSNSIYTAVEVGWKSESNRLYQVQWRTNLNSGAWSDLDGWVLGNGSTNYIFDSTRGADRKFYRVQALQ